MKIHNFFNPIQIVFEIVSFYKISFLYLVIFLMFVASLFEILSIGVFLPILNEFNGNKNFIENYFFIHDGTFESKVLFYSTLILIIFFIKNFFLLLFQFILHKFIYKTYEFLSQSIYEKYIKSKYKFFLDFSSSELISNISVEIHQFSNGSLRGVCNFLAELLVIISLIIFGCYINITLTFIILILNSIISFIFYKFSKSKIKNWAKNRQKNEINRINMIQNSVYGSKEIKIYEAQNYFISNYRLINRKLVNAIRNHNFLQTIPRLYLEIIFISLIVFSIYFSLIIKNNFSDIISELIIFILISIRIAPSINRLIMAYNSIIFSLPSSKKILLILNESLYTEKNEVINLKFKNWDKISFTNINYSYTKYSNLFTNFSYIFDRSKFYGVIGKSGVGKTTLINLLCGLIEPNSGEIKINNHSLKDFKHSWFKELGYVSQKTFISNTTIAENIAFGLDLENVNLEKVLNSLKLANLYEFITANSIRNVSLGDNGSNLSGGQIQRIGIARALYKDPSILILDEPSSSLDKKNETEFMKTIINLNKQNNLTIVFITHNSDLLHSCDFIIDLNQVNKKGK